jgi:penicillin-binding protein 2
MLFGMKSGTVLRDNQQELHHFRVRLALAAAFVLLAFALLATRLFYLQVVQH